jgi:hypothetical protein
MVIKEILIKQIIEEKFIVVIEEIIKDNKIDKSITKKKIIIIKIIKIIKMIATLKETIDIMKIKIMKSEEEGGAEDEDKIIKIKMKKLKKKNKFNQNYQLMIGLVCLMVVNQKNN